MPIDKASLFSLRAVGGIGKGKKRLVALVPAAPPVPPPEEQTEEQAQYNAWVALFLGSNKFVGQRLTISNRKVSKLAFYLYKFGVPNNVITFEIRAVDDGELLASKVWGNAVDLPAAVELIELAFATPVLINEEVRICILYQGGDASNNVRLQYQNTNVKAAEMLTRSLGLPAWDDFAAFDCAYRYKYFLP